ncbi:DUF4190 domain-containing protein [Salinibacterium sp. NK8237]|uniref:DUF4190 domain-containing protein n=1 Tax=Salinibacterium sp. NK8237 TaxID=2792038 RepID=UPI0018CEF83B|nr:DUF4190 domain-containing protein [Salinibacterium sp. NK8237]MBH0129234.1 DUF4190 domain-containing protein [Salinibacterium sp. NK8237]
MTSSTATPSTVGSLEPAVAEAPAASDTVAQPGVRTMSVLALVLGIASIFFAQSIVVPLAAIILGVFGLRDEPTGRSFSIWGIVLACVATFGWVFFVIAGAIVSLPFILFAAAL